jgi:hypothetical protein
LVSLNDVNLWLLKLRHLLRLKRRDKLKPSTCYLLGILVLFNLTLNRPALSSSALGHTYPNTNTLLLFFLSDPILITIVSILQPPVLHQWTDPIAVLVIANRARIDIEGALSVGDQ